MRKFAWALACYTMLDINLIRQNPEKIRIGIEKKNSDPKLVDKFLRFDETWRSKTKALDELKAEQNTLNKELSRGRSEDLLSRAQLLKKRILDVAKEKEEVEKKRDEILFQLPNPPFEDVPIGKNEAENKVIKEFGKKPDFSFPSKDYLALGECLGIIDIERASKVSGSRFGYLKGGAVLLEFALVRFAFDILSKEGFIPVVPPVMVKEKMMQAMGYIDRRSDKDETYFFEKDKLYLVGTSEQSIGPMHAGEIFEGKDLPRRYAGFSTCFRREAGSYGKDTKGILRVHQFDKVEMFSFTTPEESEAEHKLLLSLEEKLMQDLEIPYRVLEMCTGDLGNVAARKYDIEAWMPGQNQYRETHSTSNTTDFQSRRLDIKYKKKGRDKPEFVHMLNGTAFAIGRMLIAIIENYQTKKGTVMVPEALQDYVGKKEIAPR